jgi:hypothetical protein
MRHRRQDWETSAPHPWILPDMAVETISRRSAAVSLMAVKRCLGLRLLAQLSTTEKPSPALDRAHGRHRYTCQCLMQRTARYATKRGDGLWGWGLTRLPEWRARMSHCTAFVAHDEYARLCCEGMRWPGVRLQYRASRLAENGSRGVRSMRVRRMVNDIWLRVAPSRHLFALCSHGAQMCMAATTMWWSGSG